MIIIDILFISRSQRKHQIQLYNTSATNKLHYLWQKVVRRFLSKTVSASLGGCICERYEERERNTSNHVWI